MKYRLTFSWRDDIITTRQVILEADSKEHAEALLMNSVEAQAHPSDKITIDESEISGINGGYRDDIGVEIRKEYVNDEDDLNIQDYDIPADLYYASLDGNWNEDGDDKWGEEDEMDEGIELYIGRAPVNNEEDVNNFINKQILYQYYSNVFIHKEISM